MRIAPRDSKHARSLLGYFLTMGFLSFPKMVGGPSFMTSLFVRVVGWIGSMVEQVGVFKVPPWIWVVVFGSTFAGFLSGGWP